MSDQEQMSMGEGRLHQRLSEAWNELWDTFVDPREAWAGDDGRWWPAIGSDSGEAGANGVNNEQQLAEVRRECRRLAATNEFAINGHENRVSYIVGTGYTYRAAARPGREANELLMHEVQGVIDEFLTLNQWHRRQQEIVRRMDRDGEAFLRLFVDEQGRTRIRFVEPGQVATPGELAGVAGMSFGIETDPQDVETVWNYFIDGVRVPAEEIQHRKAHVDANVKRGLPLFYPVRKNLARAEKLLRNMSVVAEVQSAIALIRKHRGATRGGVQEFVASQADMTATSAAIGRVSHYRRYGPGTILDAPSGVEYEFPAGSIDASTFVTVLQAELRAIASRLVMPEFMLTSDASNANYASTLVAEGPAMRMFARLQAQQMADDRQCLARVLENAVLAGRLPREALDEVDVQIEAPSLAARSHLDEVQAFAIEFEHGILSPQTWSQKRGLDYRQEQANWSAADASVKVRGARNTTSAETNSAVENGHRAE